MAEPTIGEQLLALAREDLGGAPRTLEDYERLLRHLELRVTIAVREAAAAAPEPSLTELAFVELHVAATTCRAVQNEYLKAGRGRGGLADLRQAEGRLDQAIRRHAARAESLRARHTGRGGSGR